MQMHPKLTLAAILALGVLAVMPAPAVAQKVVTPDRARAIAKEAYIFTYPVVMNYRTMYMQAIKGDRAFGKWLHLGLSSPADKDIVTPNNDTPYSYAWVDLRAEPWVLTMPMIEKERFYTSQWDDLWGYVLDNPGSVIDGNDGHSVMFASPTWKGETPKGIKRVVRGESDFLGTLTRTQVIGGEKDLPRVTAIQQSYKLQPLSQFLGTPSPAAAPAIKWPEWKEGDDTREAYWGYVQFLLPLTTPHPDDKAMYNKMTSIGLEPGAAWDAEKLDPAIRQAIQQGLEDARDDLKKRSEGGIDAAKFFGTRSKVGTDYTSRALGVYMGIFGNVPKVSVYLSMPDDSEGKPLDGSKASYTLTFPKDNIPPVKYFWSITMYSIPERLLVENPINRYSIGSSTPGLKYNDDGSLTIYVSAKSPGKDKENNWLPAPNGTFWTVLRNYGPDQTIIDGTYKRPDYKADVTPPATGVVMHPEYAKVIGRMAYVWGWPMVNQMNRRAAITQAPEPGRLNGVLPVAPRGRIGMLSDYIDPGQTFVTCPNQDVVYGLGFFSLDEEPSVIQVPDFGDRFWVYALYDARTDQFASVGKPYKTKPGFYLLVGPKWKGEKPDGIEAVIRSSTALANAIPRVFMDDTPEDREAIQPVLNQIVAYPLTDFDGKMKTKDWRKAASIPGPKSEDGGETKWVVPEKFFDQLGTVLDTVQPLPGEEALYAQFRVLLDSAAKDPEVKKALVAVAVETEKDVVANFFLWKHNGRPAGNGWNRSTNNAQFGTDYFNRTGTAKSNMFDNKPTETQYFYTDDDSTGVSLDGKNSYEITFAPGQEPPVNGFWSMTLYNAEHFFHPNDLKRYSLGTKNKGLKRNADGSLTLYVGAKSPGKDKESNWLPAPNGHFSLYIRAYWGQKGILDGTWTPPAVKKS